MKKFIKCICVFFVFAFSFSNAFSQVTFTSWVHSPYITLYALDTSAGVSTAAGVTLDDVYSGLIPLGFSFNFYGTAHSQCVIGANGSICFTDSLAATYNPWPITTTLLGNPSVYNSICGPWCDMDVVYGGVISYFTSGTAPNRIFGANFCHDAMYTSSSCPGQYTTTQILIYESTNIAEVHLAHKTACTAWNGGYAIIGVQNATGTAATAAPGRDYPNVWTATNEAWRFTPISGGSAYSVDSIAYSPITYYTINWNDSATGAYLGSGDSIVLTSPTTPVTYIASAVTCNDAFATGADTAARASRLILPISTGTGVLTSANQIYISPNPAYNQLNITAAENITSVLITNIIGNVVYNNTYNTNKLEINTSTLSKGIYYIKINGIYASKFVKE